MIDFSPIWNPLIETTKGLPPFGFPVEATTGDYVFCSFYSGTGRGGIQSPAPGSMFL